ncbi:hypothetical protein XM25_21467 [Devosia sp. H5989]|nr:hypothetical protein XM25_21467 [Devosia sp. H5989]
MKEKSWRGVGGRLSTRAAPEPLADPEFATANKASPPNPGREPPSNGPRKRLSRHRARGAGALRLPGAATSCGKLAPESGAPRVDLARSFSYKPGQPAATRSFPGLWRFSCAPEY